MKIFTKIYIYLIAVAYLTVMAQSIECDSNLQDNGEKNPLCKKQKDRKPEVKSGDKPPNNDIPFYIYAIFCFLGFCFVSCILRKCIEYLKFDRVKVDKKEKTDL